ncbi:MAG TPA: YerC/YecD family TrpR-related protein [Patescibacteria group bacterium]|jgi:TrpR-related protein YerC/YecD|nr:YerC/YecD family TrpR-related protein [Patescibacteria group bacterium]
MAKAKKEIEEKEYFRDIHFLYEIIGTLKNTEEIKLFMKDILMPSELRMLKRRWHIANLLYDGMKLRDIARTSKTSTQTVSKIKAILEGERGGLALAIERARVQMKKEREKYLESKGLVKGSTFVKGLFK